MSGEPRERLVGMALLAISEAAVFGVAALLHAGVSLPLGIVEPPLAPAMIVETTIALGLALDAIALFTCSRSAWSLSVGAHAWSVCGVLLGLWAQRDGGGSNGNRLFHRVMLVVTLGALLWLMSPIGRRTVRRRDTVDA